MDRSLLAFRSKLEQSSVGLFFFGGACIQCKGENFLATKDTNFVDEISCRHTSFPLNDVIDIFEESKVTTKYSFRCLPGIIPLLHGEVLQTTA